VKQHNEGNKKRSWVQDHYSKSGSVEAPKASCVYYDVLIACPSANGTSALTNHLLRCKKYAPNVDKSQKILSFKSACMKIDGSVQPTMLEN